MSRRHQPGCPCCDNACCDGTDIPTITISGWTLSESSGSTETCCLHRVFTPDAAVEEACCTELNSHSITYECVRDHYTFLNILPLVSSSTLPCPLPDDYCCPDPAVKVATITTEETVTLTGHFRARISIQDVRVIWGKEEIDCGGTVACRYFVKLLITITYNGRILQSLRRQGSIVGASTDACVTYDGSLDDSWDTTICDDPCNAELGVSDPCTIASAPSCFGETGTLCVERIKYFDTRPTGNITFSSADVPGTCDEPACNQVCGGYDSTSVCVAAPDSVLPPLWCSNPPTVSQTTNNYTIGSQCVGSKTVLIVSPFDCCNPLTQICNTNNNCETAWSQTCEEIEYPEYTIDPEECRYTSADQLSIEGFPMSACGCTNSMTVPSFLTLPDCTDTPCPACCYEPVVCAECPYCYPKYAGVGIWFSNNDITITTNCSTYVKPSDCCFSIPSITVNITYA